MLCGAVVGSGAGAVSSYVLTVGVVDCWCCHGCVLLFCVAVVRRAGLLFVAVDVAVCCCCCRLLCVGS